MALLNKLFAVAIVLALASPVPTAAAAEVTLQPASANEEPVEADHVKAAFLFNFAKFVTWPAAPAEQPLSICVLGAKDFRSTLEDVIGGRSVRNRAVVVREQTEESDCQILFVSDAERDRAKALLARFATKPILTVGETEGFAARGGIINFRVDDNRIRFEVNPDAARRAGLELSSQLLKLAILVRE